MTVLEFFSRFFFKVGMTTAKVVQATPAPVITGGLKVINFIRGNGKDLFEAGCVTIHLYLNFLAFQYLFGEWFPWWMVNIVFPFIEFYGLIKLSKIKDAPPVTLKSPPAPPSLPRFRSTKTPPNTTDAIITETLQEIDAKERMDDFPSVVGISVD